MPCVNEQMADRFPPVATRNGNLCDVQIAGFGLEIPFHRKSILLNDGKKSF